MAALLLSAAGSAAGSAVFGPAGAFAGRLAGAIAGSVIDQSLFSGGTIQRSREGPRLSDLDVMASTEGAPVPRAYGRVRLSGQIIWATALDEAVTTRTETSGGGGGKGGGGGGAAQTVTTTTTTYNYFANVAVALCEGPASHIARVWADGKPLDLSGITFRFHRGDEDQTPDPLVVAKEGADYAPAYRGIAYVVFERLPLANFGNRVPQLSFELVRPVGELEDRIRAITLIPGATEFGYEPATVVQVLGAGQLAPENRHIAYAPSDVVASLDELQALCQNLERVAIVAAWFGDDLRAGTCTIAPRIDNAQKATHGATWSVAGVTRGGAQLVSQVDDRPAFGGTPSDSSVINLIGELKARGLKVTLYPFVMMDIAHDNELIDPRSGTAPQPAFPWRGDITCDPAPGIAGTPDGTAPAGTQVDLFFTRDGAGGWNYRRMVLHYATLAASAGGVDAFLIGSELKGLTRVRSASGFYPAVTQLAALAADVKEIVGDDTIVTYGADWTEYGAHVVDADANEVRFPLDPLWASPAVDAVGIDFYAPLSDWRDTPDHADREMAQSIHDRSYLTANLSGGEAYDFFYADADARLAQIRSPITDGLGKPWMFRQKDIWNFWSQEHVERVAGAELAEPTAWVPYSKPIWLTEIGCPAVDKGSNQPSVFPDVRSASGGYPHFSNERRDDLIQRRMLETILTAFDDSPLNPVSPVYDGPMISPDGIHVWTWDARPYPVFPSAVDIWSDGPNWDTGHWLNGRLGGAHLDGLVSAILRDHDIPNVHAAALGEGADGYVIDRPISARAAIEPLAMIYAFDAAERNGSLTFRPRGGAPSLELMQDHLVFADGKPATRFARAQETELPREFAFGFSDAGADYRRATASSRRLVGGAARMVQSDVPVVTGGVAAQRRAEIWLQDIWAGRDTAEFTLPPSLMQLTPGDVVALDIEDRRRLLEIREIVDTDSRAVKARVIDPEIFNLPLEQAARRTPAIPVPIGPVQMHLLDLPALDGQEPVVLTRAAIFAEPWPGPVAIWRSNDGLSYQRAAVALAPSIVGETLNPLPRGPASRWDFGNRLTVRLSGGALVSVSDTALLGGANLAALRQPDGAWEILQFAQAELVGERTYILSRLLRGLGGSEGAMADLLAAGAPFVLLDEHVIPVARGLDALDLTVSLRAVAAGRDHGDVAAVFAEMTPGATALRPLSPVHLRAARQSGDIVITWTRRTRIDGDSWATQDVPLGEADERYAIDILSGSDVVRSLQSSSPAMTYLSADELADFGTPQSSLTVRVAQLSAVAGRGVSAQAILQL